MTDPLIDREAIRLYAIERRASAALPGPWRWGGYTDGSVELRTAHSGGMRVLTSMRGEPCTGEAKEYGVVLLEGACDNCVTNYKAYESDAVDFDYLPCLKPENLDTLWVWGMRKTWVGFCEPINRYAVKEQPYRNDVARVDHPDAEFIANSRVDVAFLLNVIKRLQARG